MNKNSAQSMVEYAIFACFLVAALVGMQMYLKRGIQGKIKSNAEQIGAISYSPGATLADINISRNINESSNSYEQEINGSNKSIYESTANSLQQTNRFERVLGVDQEPVR